MDEKPIPQHSLVLYKKRPARVLQSGEQVLIELTDGNRVKVRPKDITLLHPGPLDSLEGFSTEASADEQAAELAWQLLVESGESLSLAELAELAFGSYSPRSAWQVWTWLDNGLYFSGTPLAIRARSAQQVQAERAARQALQAAREAQARFLQRAARGQVSLPEDAPFLREIEEFALGKRKDSPLLRQLGRSERTENAHSLLLEWGVWPATLNPYPIRLGLPLHPPEAELPPLQEEERLDLSALEAFAIDEADNQDPDDALSLIACRLDEAGNFQGGALWVHVADAAALIPPDHPADEQARQRAATLYLPEGAVPMLPPPAVACLGLGLQEVSPSLSFKIELDANAQIVKAEVHPAWVRVQRLSYQEVEERLDDEPFRSLYRLAQEYQLRRTAAGAYLLDLPEVMVRVVNGQVAIRPLARLRSRDLVREAMIMAGEAAAHICLHNRLPAPFVTQEPFPSEVALPNLPLLSLAQRYALRRLLKRSQVSTVPRFHAGIGLAAYCRATSPLRRYLDLVLHQQLRAWLRGQSPLDEQALIERLGHSEALVGVIAQAETLSRRHWTLVYLLQHPQWEGEGVIVETSGRRATLLIPDLALEATLQLPREMPLDSCLRLRVNAVNLPELEAYFTVLGECRQREGGEPAL